MTTPPEPQMAHMFNGISQKYDFLNSLLSLGRHHAWKKKLVHLIPPAFSKDEILLDVATGTGDIAFLAAKLQPTYHKIIGLDISVGMLEEAKKKRSLARKDQSPEMIFEIGSAMNLNLASQSVQTITISFGLRNIFDKAVALDEFYRTLKPKGTLLIMEFFPPEKGLSHLFMTYFQKILPKIASLFSDQKAYQYLPDSVLSFYDTTTLKSHLKKTGFQVVGLHKMLFGCCQILVCRKP